jgi:hypothetical protein
MTILREDIDFQRYMSWSLFMLNYLSWEMIPCKSSALVQWNPWNQRSIKLVYCNPCNKPGKCAVMYICANGFRFDLFLWFWILEQFHRYTWPRIFLACYRDCNKLVLWIFGSTDSIELKLKIYKEWYIHIFSNEYLTINYYVFQQY